MGNELIFHYRAKKKRDSITKRWLINSVGLMGILLLITVISFSIAIKNYYYASAKQYVSTRMNMVSSFLANYLQNTNTNYNSEVKKLVESFEDKDKMELLIIDTKGKVVISSSGFSPSVDIFMDDYYQAVNSSDKFGFYVGKLSNGEKVMSLCTMIEENKTNYNAIKVMVSLKKVNNQIYSYIIILAIICILFFILILVSGLYFIKSIVIPVRQIGNTARKFAIGDFTLRVNKKNDDEIGDLCDIINYMADEISNAESMKNEFMSSVSHELRTPLTAIKGWSETLASMPDDKEIIKKGMRVIESETDRLSQMVEELLDFSRIQNGRFTLNKTTIDILAELGEAVLIYTERAKKEEIEIVYNEPEMLSFVNGDKNRIRQVFINIIDNAIKYSNKGGIVVIEAMEENDYVVVTISDTGCGIAEFDLPKIKKKFYKANHTRRGSGIGLAVADEIITMHGGTLDIISKLDVGTTVMIKLPIEKREQENTDSTVERKIVDE